MYWSNDTLSGILREFKQGQVAQFRPSSRQGGGVSVNLLVDLSQAGIAPLTPKMFVEITLDTHLPLALLLSAVVCVVA